MEMAPITQNMVMMMITAIIIGSIALVISMSLVEPLLSVTASTAKTANRISLSLEAMSGVEKGSLKIPVELGSQYSIRVSFEEKGERNGYKIDDAGWYVIVSSRSYEQEGVSVSRIYNYPETEVDALEAYIARPRMVCIYKERDEHPRVSKCRS